MVVCFAATLIGHRGGFPSRVMDGATFVTSVVKMITGTPLHVRGESLLLPFTGWALQQNNCVATWRTPSSS
jgi:hypothetical protein